MTPHLRDSAQFNASLPKAFSVASARQLRDRLERVEPREGRGFSRAIAVLLSLLIVSAAIVKITQRWPLDTTLRHFAAAAGCSAARAVAPARAGEPGYWPWLDRNSRGVSCISQHPAPSTAGRDGAVNRPQQSAHQTPASRLRGAL